MVKYYINTFGKYVLMYIIHTYTHTYTQASVRKYILTNMIHSWIHTYIHTHIHTYIHTYIHHLCYLHTTEYIVYTQIHTFDASMHTWNRTILIRISFCPSIWHSCRRQDCGFGRGKLYTLRGTRWNGCRTQRLSLLLRRRFFTLCSAVEGIRCLSTLKTLCASALSKKAARPGVFNRGTLCAEDPCLARLECKGTSRKLQDPLSRLECLYAKRHSMHVCAWYMYVDIYAHTYMYSMYICTRIQINKYWYIYTRTSTFICVCICTFVSDLYLDLSETW